MGQSEGADIMGMIMGRPLGEVLEEYERASIDLIKAKAAMEAAMEAYGRAATRQVMNLKFMGAPDHKTACQWVKAWREKGVLPFMQAPPTQQEAYVAYTIWNEEEHRQITRVLNRYKDEGTPYWAAGVVYELGVIKGKQIDRARRKKNK